MSLPRIGLASCPYLDRVLTDAPGAFDYVEVSFEQLRHDPRAIDVGKHVPLILHCASLSLAGFVPPAADTVTAVKQAAVQTGTPWLGEHLAFITAAALDHGGTATIPWNYDVGYTVAPALNDETLDRVTEAIDSLTQAIGVPLIIENPPSYFAMPDSTYSQADFLCALCDRSDVGLLLDLTHLYVSATNLGFDAMDAALKLPADRIVEIHISGASEQESVTWDDHATLPPEPVFDLLAAVAARARPQAVTLEFNWLPDFPMATLLDMLARARQTIADAQGAPV